MSNFYHPNVPRFGKAIMHSDIARIYLTKFKELHSRSGSSNETQSQEASFGEGHNQQSFSREQSNKSSSYQSHHRRAYERKRSYYERERRKSGNYDRTNFSFLTGTNHYGRLDLDPSADASAIKSAYYGLSKLYHPDIAGKDNVQAAENFRLITESYDVLSNPELRAEYDKSLNLIPQTSPGDHWKPSSDSRGRFNDDNFNSIYRKRQADQVFRSKQEEALDREKRLNPRKFRAGAFSSHQDFDSSERLMVLQQRLKTLGRQVLTKSGSIDHSDFYRAHLYDVIQRKKEGMEALQAQRIRAEQSGGDLVTLFPMLASLIAGVVLFAGYNIFFVNFDLAAFLDSYVAGKRGKEKSDC